MGAVFVLPAGLGAGKDAVALVDGEIAVSGFDIVGAVMGAVAAEVVLLIGDAVQNDHLNAKISLILIFVNIGTTDIL